MTASEPVEVTRAGRVLLRQLAKVRMGKTILSKELVSAGVPVYSAGVSDEPWGYVERSDLQFGEETLVVSARGNIGMPKLPRRHPFVCTQTTIAISLADPDLRKFVYYYLQSVDFSAFTSQTTIPMIRVSDVNEIEVPLPDPTSRASIVAEIEKQFSRLDEAVANLKRVKANLRRYRASVLLDAFEGRRSDSDDPSSDQTKFELPEGWIWRTYAEIGEVTTGFTPSTTETANFGGDIPFFKPTDLDAADNVRQARECLSEQGLARGRRLAAGSVLVTCIGATIGKTGLAQVACATNQQINAVSPIAGLADPRFIFWWTVSPRGQRQIHSNASATTLPIINKSKFSALAVPLPPLAEQRRIVGEVDRRLSIVREIEAEVDANLKRASFLRRSVLSGVFAVDGPDSISKA